MVGVHSKPSLRTLGAIQVEFEQLLAGDAFGWRGSESGESCDAPARDGGAV